MIALAVVAAAQKMAKIAAKIAERTTTFIHCFLSFCRQVINKKVNKFRRLVNMSKLREARIKLGTNALHIEHANLEFIMSRPFILSAILAALTTAFAFHAFAKAPSKESVASTEPAAATAEEQTAIFAGGCFWCVESDFEKLEGVREVISGYTGGAVNNPSYKQVAGETTGHVEAATIYFDPAVVSYRELVDYFFRHVDPLDDGGQFCDRGFSYTTAIFPASPEQRLAAEASKAEAEESLGKTVVTRIVDASTFWPAEDYHQDYYKKNPLRYKYYRTSCGRDRQIAKIWGEANATKASAH